MGLGLDWAGTMMRTGQRWVLIKKWSYSTSFSLFSGAKDACCGYGWRDNKGGMCSTWRQWSEGLLLLAQIFIFTL